jgi:hypothetical protein
VELSKALIASYERSMMSTAYESIMQGLNEALDHAQGK